MFNHQFQDTRLLSLVVLFLVQIGLRNVDCSKVLTTEKNLCKDLRDCQVYFPCSFFVTGYLYPPTIQQCPNDLIFSEEKQECVQPTTKEDFECLLAFKYSTKSGVKEIARRIRPKTTTPVADTPAESSEEDEADFKLIPGINDYEPVSTKTAPTSSRLAKHFKLKKERSMKKSEDEQEPTFSRQLSPNAEDPAESSEEEVTRSSETSTKKKSSSLIAKKSALKKNIKKQVVVQTTTESSESRQDSGEYEVEGDDNGYKRVCVVTNWSQYRPGKGHFKFEYINIHLCNMLIFSSATINEIDASDSYEYTLNTVQHNDLELYAKLAAFKSRNPSLKTLLRITDDNGRLYSKLSKKPESRASFIRNVIDFIELHEFNGIDIDWQYPTGPAGNPADKTNFVLLLKEFRSEMSSNQILSTSISPLTDKIQNSYTIFEVNKYVDFVNVEAYDYYGPWDKRTGIIAPLKKMDEQYLTEAFMNIDGTVTFLKALGMTPNKIVLGLASYARSFTLLDAKQHGINAATTGNGFSGSFTKINGLLSHYEVCEAQKKGRFKEEWHELAQMPYMHNDDGEWISFENEESLARKIEYVKANGLAGASVNSIDMDDFRGSFCNVGPYPFLRASLGLLVEDAKIVKVFNISVTTTTRVVPKSTTKIRVKSATRAHPKPTTVNHKARMVPPTKAIPTKHRNPTQSSSKMSVIGKILNAKYSSQAPQQANKPAKTPARAPVKPAPQATSKAVPFILITPPPAKQQQQPQAQAQYQQQQQQQQQHQHQQNNFISQIEYQEQLWRNELKEREMLEQQAKQLEMQMQMQLQEQLKQQQQHFQQQQQQQQHNQPPLPPPPPPNKLQKAPNHVQYNQPPYNPQQKPPVHYKPPPPPPQQQKPVYQPQQPVHHISPEFSHNKPPQQHQQPPMLPPPPPPPQNQYKPPQEPQKSIEEWQREIEKVTLEQQKLLQQAQSQSQQYPSQQYNNIQEQQHKIQQQQAIQQQNQREWELQQKQHQQQEQWIKDLQYRQQKQNEVLEQQSHYSYQNNHYAAKPPAPAPAYHSVTQAPPPVQNYNVWSQQNSYVQAPAPPPPPPPPAPPAYKPAVEAADNRCVNKRGGIYRDEYDCSAFYVCEVISNYGGASSSRMHKFVCPSGLTFNMFECTCDWPKNDLPCAPLAQSFCKETGPDFVATTLAPAAAAPPAVTKSPLTYFTKQPKIEYFPPPPWSHEFSCFQKEQGLYRDPTDCTKFYYCQSFSPAGGTGDSLLIKHDFVCPSGLHFNLYNCQCDWPTMNGCSTYFTSQSLTHCESAVTIEKKKKKKK